MRGYLKRQITLIYNLFLLFFSVLAILGVKRNSVIDLILFFMLILFIGLRNEIGGDWNSYLQIYNKISVMVDNERVYLITDPLYQLINYIVIFFDGNIYFVNFIAGFIFVTGLMYFINNLKLSYIAYVVAFPILIIVMGMGYVRQSIAFSLLLIAYVFYIKDNHYKAVLFILVATLFHKTAIIGFMIYLLKINKRNLKYVILVLLFILFFSFFMYKQLLFLINNYLIEQRNFAKGAIFRNSLFIFTSFLFFFLINKLKKRDYCFYKINIFFAVYILVVYIFTFIAPTMSDRLMMYAFPLQLVFFSKVSFLFKGKLIKILIKLIIILISFLILNIWLFYSFHAQYWIPYKSIIF